LQHLPSISSQQQNEERKIADELRRTEVQDSEELFPTNPADARGRRRKQLRIRRKAAPSGDEPPSS
ncbi:MAG: hypothetical protein GWM98_09120, partial [Nitrospinaceae bacterium]|nr:hypothetical protein [Nitrospinaceae bacterium]NIR54621.1 hypothetical protein [Nitrospinaceae bacterium]NIS85038.1 hypothetical protein [Nitrospinaceae bacterium]NIT81854.1 hypothetical protein [Nitrospinaceae bacterium]NIU44119.1 hypothetical protein [Nitrospinaceae bacterium]